MRVTLGKLAATAAFALLAAAGQPALAQSQVGLTSASVIGSTGSYGPSEVAGNIFDQQAGSVSDYGPAGQNQYWLNTENGPENAYITIDLGGSYELSSFDLFNTHNGGYGDRGTGNFSIVGANAIVADGTNGFTLAGPVTVLAVGTLSAAPVSDPIAAQSFAASSDESFRYLQFLPTSVASTNPPCCSANVYGLSELRVFGSAGSAGAAPEPASWALMVIGVGLVGATLRYRQRRTILRQA